MENNQNKGIDFIENAEALQKKVMGVEGVFNQNKKLFTYIGGGLIALVAAFFAYKYYNDSQEKEAQAQLFDAVFSFEADSLNKALKGQGGNAGLLELADNYGGTKAGKLASLYAGVALMNQNKFTEAIDRLKAFDANDQVLQAKTYALIGDCYVELGKNTEAVDYFSKASSTKENKLATPGYMIKLALAYSENKQAEKALETYTKLAEKYPASTEAVIAKKYKSRLEAELGK
jgi:TolA-binding protein